MQRAMRTWVGGEQSMCCDVDFLAAHQSRLHLLGEDSAGGETTNKLQSPLGHAIQSALVFNGSHEDVAVTPGGS